MGETPVLYALDRTQKKPDDLASRRSVVTTVPVTAAIASPTVGQIKVLDTYLTNAELFPEQDWPEHGARLLLRRDPERRYDPASVQVLNQAGLPLGYLPPVSAQVLGVLMDHGTAAEAVAKRGGKLSVSIVTV